MGQIFVYTGTAYDAEDAYNDADTVGDASMPSTNIDDGDPYSTPVQNHREFSSNMSDGTADDWHSAGAASDPETDQPVPGRQNSKPRLKAGATGATKGRSAEKVRWRRPLI